MNVNVTTYKVKFMESGSIEVILQSSNRLERASIINQDRGNTYADENYPTSVIITKEELPLFLACLKGESTFYPFFSDISYLLRVYADGYTYIKLNGNDHYSQDYFTFPNKNFIELHTLIENHIESPKKYELDLTPFTLDYYRESVLPNVSWNYIHRMSGKWIDYKYTERIDKDIVKSLTKWKTIYSELSELLDRLQRIAENYSVFGEKILIDISFDCFNKDDDKPDSYYFVIHSSVPDKNGNTRIMNGGLIAHHNSKDDTYQYSMHT